MPYNEFDDWLTKKAGGTAPAPQAPKVQTPPQPTVQKPPAVNTPTATPELPRGKIYSGGFVSDVFDTLQAPVSGFASFLRGARKGVVESRGKGFGEMLSSWWKGGVSNIAPGVKARTNMADYMGDLGVKNKYAREGLGLAAEITSDPLNLLNKGGKLLSKIPGVAKTFDKVKAATKAETLLPKLGPLGEQIGEKFVYRFKQPADYVRRAEKLTNDLARGEQAAVEIGTNLKYAPADIKIGDRLFKKGEEFTPAIQRRLSQLIQGGISTNEGLTSTAAPAIEKFKSLADDMIKYGNKDKEVFQKYYGKYLPTYYREFVEGGGMGSTRKMVTERFTKKKDLVELGKSYLASKGEDAATIAKKGEDLLADLGKKYSDELGKINEAAYPAARGIAEESRNVGLAKFFDFVNKRYAKDAMEEGLVRVPKDDKYGQIAGKYVPKFVHDEIVGDWLNKGLLQKQNFIEKFIGRVWKPGKTVLNPGQQGRNFVSNFILNEMVGPGSFTKYPKAVNEFRNKGKFYQEAVQANVIGKGFAGQEIDDLLLKIERLKPTTKERMARVIGDLWNTAVEKGGNIQSSMEEIGKLQQFIHQREAGKTVAEAAQLAEKALFDYGKITPFERKLRSSVIPFYTFARKSTPLFAETVAKHPTRISQYGKIENAVEGLSQDREGERKFLPAYMRDMTRIPGTKKSYFAGNYIYPWANVYGESDLPFGLNIPAADVASKALYGYDPYYQAPLTESIIPGDMTKKKAGAVARTLLPAFPTNMVGRVKPELLGYPDFVRSKTPTAANIIGDITGMKAYDLDIVKALKQRGYDINDINTRTQKQINEAAQAGDTARIKKLIEERDRQIKEILGQ